MKCSQFCLYFWLLYIAIILYWVPGTPFSLQWIAEGSYWCIFPIWTGILAFDTPSIPIWLLKEHHSRMKVVEFWMDKDKDAVQKFVEHARFDNHRKYEHEIVILRNIWSNSSNVLKDLNDFKKLRAWANSDVIHRQDYFYPNGQREQKEAKFSQLIDDMESANYPVTISFDYQFLPEQDRIYSTYKDLMSEVGLKETLMDHFFITFIFLFKGSIFRSSLHANYAPGYFLPVANSKAWRWFNKLYMPYLGLHKGNPENGGLRYGDKMVWNEDLGVPYTDIIINPGDLLYFGSWHPHQVVNLVPDKLGLAIGIRHVGKKDLFGEPFLPLSIYNYVHAPRMMGKHRKKKKAFLYDGGKELDACRNTLTSKPYTWGFNGTTMVRWDYVRHTNGSCTLQQLEKWKHLKWIEPLLPQLRQT